MSRCTNRRNLELHHLTTGGEAGINNAQVLCTSCRQHAVTYGTPGKAPLSFAEHIKEKALKRAGYQCECTSARGCH
jgi:hypothetical protein